MNQSNGQSPRRVVATTALVASLAILPVMRPFSASAAWPGGGAQASGCALAHGIRHVIFIEFDNTHFMRDIGRDGSTTVPSDLEQTPRLLRFIENNGTLLSNYHTPLISHTSDDITTSETGVYPGRHGVATAANSYYYYDSTGTPTKTSGFTYWTSRIGDGQYNFTRARNTNAPAPWVPFTRAGCNVGAAAMTGFVLENTTSDLTAAFGPHPPASATPFADFVGAAVHCARANPLCASTNGGVPDRLPNEPNADGSAASTDASGTSTAYEGYNALYGHKLLTQALTSAGQIAATQVLTDINGHPIVDDVNGSLTPGFPSFSLAPQYSLGYVADMQEHGVPVTFAYIITPHRPLPANPYGYGFPTDPRDYGPGEAHYVAQLRQYEDAFTRFFTRLANDGINKTNTLFLFMAEEGDHPINSPPTPAGCNGVTIPCTYSQTGELTTNYNGLLQAEQGIVTTPSSAVVNSDDAPDIYLRGNPGPADPRTRAIERATSALTVTNPLSVALGVPANEPLVQDMANPTEFRILHMLTADPLRTPTFTAFAQPDYYVQGSSACATSTTPATTCVTQTPTFNWNHGDVQPQISTVWLGLVGPGILHRGLDGPSPTAEAHGARFGTFGDHTDTRATILALLGLRDDYSLDGRVLVEDLDRSVLPKEVVEHFKRYAALARAYKALTAPVGPFGLATLQISTVALKAGDATYTTLEKELTRDGSQRDALTHQMQAILEGTIFRGQRFDSAQANHLLKQSRDLLARVEAQANSTVHS
jgi:hypothetical protein